MMNTTANPMQALRLLNRERARLEKVIGENPGSAIVQLFGRHAQEQIDHDIHILQN